MKKLFIHIGLHKTATTSLQYEYFPNLEGLSYFQYSVPHIYTNLGTYDLNNYVLITNEELSGTSWNSKWKNGIKNDFHWIDSFKSSIRNLKCLHPDATILIMFRKHGDLLVSMYKQYIQEGGILPFEEFYGDGKVIRDKDLDFRERVTFLEEYFEDVVIFSFEKFRKEGVDYLNCYFEQFGLRENKKKETSNIHNKSLKGKKMNILRSINHGYRHLPMKLRKLLRLLRISPRDILQSRLTFWQPDELPYLIEAKVKINEVFKSDWEYVESKAWRPKNIYDFNNTKTINNSENTSN